MAFIFDTSKGETPQSIARQRQLAEMMMGQLAGSRANSVGEGVVQLGNGIIAGLLARKADRAERESMSSADALATRFTDYLADRNTFPGAPSGVVDPMSYRDAIASIESQGSGDYSALGPETNGDRPYGRYQVMGANIGPWTKEALGQEMTPEAFLASPEAQDAVFDQQFGKNVEKYGNPQDAASVWFTGRPQASGAGATDALGTTGAGYVDKFNTALGGTPPAQSGLDVRLLMEVVRNPFIDEGSRSVASLILGQELKRNAPPAPTDTMRNLDWRARQAGLQPGTPAYREFMATGGSKDGVNVTVNTGEGGEFFKELDKQNAQMFGTLQQEGINAGQTMVRLDRLESLLSGLPTGAVANFQKIAGDWGINTDGLDNIQAAQALINQMVPQQRPAGSGPMSDADLELFKQSVPRIINQQGGNQIIIDTMRGIARYTVEQGRIADAVANREITPAAGRKALAALQNPLAGLRSADKGEAPQGVDPADWEFMTPEERHLFHEP